MIRYDWIKASSGITISAQCDLASIPRATHYLKNTPQVRNETDLLLCGLIDAEYTKHPFYGSRKMVVHLNRCGYSINRKRVQRLMRLLVVRPNQVWSTDITYIKLAYGFVYLIAVIDWYSRKVLSWRVSNTMDADFCVVCLEEALRKYEKPEIFNTDQGSQFTSESFTSVLKREGIQISMDSRGRAFDNIFVERLWRSVKYENVYLMGYDTVIELNQGLTEYFTFYNAERPHQNLQYKVPCEVYESADSGGAIIVDRFKLIKQSNGYDCTTVLQ